MNGKVTASHLERQAYVYVRQSTNAQVHEHAESRRRQYALAERAASLGWSPSAVVIVDEDQGRSGASAEGRDGFARLARAVAEGKAGAIFAVEPSRLARCSQDWQRLLSLCAVARVVVVDEQSVYDPGHHDDKLLLDFKGAMSEQELYWLSLRLAGGRLNKARRGESYVHPPAGYIWGGRGLLLDPDEAVRRAVQLVFERFAVEPSAHAVLRWAHTSGFLMPTRYLGTSEVVWTPLGYNRLLNMLRNPVYAGVYVYGRLPTTKALVNGEIRKVRRRLDEPNDWPVRIAGAHGAYLSWEAYVKNQAKLRQNRSWDAPACRGAPREGDALLAGIMLCGRCGRRMGAHYHSRPRRWLYVCYGGRVQGDRLCWTVSGWAIDRAVEKLFLSTMVPSEIDLSLAVEREIGHQAASLEKAWSARIEQARYEATRAERRYKAEEPENLIVVRTLAAEWEQRLRDLEAAEKQYAEARRARRVELRPQDRARIRELARDLPAVWKAPTASTADRKAMLRLVIEAIALQPVDVPRRMTRIRVQWHSGSVDELEIARPGRGEGHRHRPEAVQRIRELAAQGVHDEEIARQLNAEEVRTGFGNEWNLDAVRTLRSRMKIPRVAPDRPRMPPLPHRHPDGRYSVPGVMARFGVTKSIVHGWIARGIVPTSRADFGTHRNVHWIELHEAATTRLSELVRRNGKEN